MIDEQMSPLAADHQRRRKTMAKWYLADQEEFRNALILFSRWLPSAQEFRIWNCSYLASRRLIDTLF